MAPDLSTSRFEVIDVNGGGAVINDRGRTVAIVTQRGYVDWLLRSPAQEGPLINSIHKDTHLSYTMGVKFELACAHVTNNDRGTQLTGYSHRIEEKGARLILVGEGANVDGAASRTEAELSVTADGQRYEWKLRTEIVNRSGDELALPLIEYNNIYPSLAYRGILHSNKEFDCTLVAAGDGTIWRFPHQHSLHYGGKLKNIRFAKTSWAGFFGMKEEALVVRVERSDLDLAWEICTMYYDLHCCAMPSSLPPGGKVAFTYRLSFLEKEASLAAIQTSRPVVIDAGDRARHDYPGLELGLNRFDKPAPLNRPNEVLSFRLKAPETEWERPAHPGENGALRLQSKGETVVLRSNPPIHAVNGTTLCVKALVRFKDVAGRGFSLRVRSYSYCWEPEPDFYPVETVESTPQTGTSDTWVAIAVPGLMVPAGPVEDRLLRFELVLEGEGTAWLTDLEVTVRDWV